MSRPETVAKSFKMGEQPEGVKVTPDGKLVYVTWRRMARFRSSTPKRARFLRRSRWGIVPAQSLFYPRARALT